MTEAELAASPPVGGRIVEHRGRFWREAYPGLYGAIHPLGRYRPEEATRPTRLCWAYHATLAEDATGQADATEPMHLLADVASFGPHAISSNRRYQLRRSRRSVEFVSVTDVGALASQGSEVFRQAMERTQNPWARGAFEDELGWYVGTPSAVLLAGMVDGKLGGWLAGYAVGETAYIEIVDVATDALSSYMSIGLHFEFLEACRRGGAIREIVHSPHVPEDPKLCTFKASIGFPVVHVPSRFVMAPVAETLVRWRRPFLYYRLSGRAVGPVPGALAAGEGAVDAKA